ncbi:MAG: hypothetical protein KDD06_29200 [Phaeodactylibacter sp.]|nr:hypothetical protein [Phaeodactylibacter sp.]MCB9291294.1 phospholipase [Lewinellaceae bacterium]
MHSNHTISVPRTAHYSTIGEAGDQTRFFWIACHGYGQLAQDFIQPFRAIAAADTFILAPEGLSRFYWGGFTGKPVASWMTREGRLHEIADYSNYLTTLYDLFLGLMQPDVHIILLGFSQGCATQMRWAMRTFPAFHHLIFWAGSIPEDLDYRPRLGYLSDKSLHFVYGNQDQFLTPERVAQQRELIRANGLEVREHTFEGKHTVEEEPLKQLAERIRNGS